MISGWLSWVEAPPPPAPPLPRPARLLAAAEEAELVMLAEERDFMLRSVGPEGKRMDEERRSIEEGGMERKVNEGGTQKEGGGGGGEVKEGVTERMEERETNIQYQLKMTNFTSICFHSFVSSSFFFITNLSFTRFLLLLLSLPHHFTSLSPS